LCRVKQNKSNQQNKSTKQMTTLFRELYSSRSYVKEDGRIVPHFWKPQKVEKTPLCFLSDETREVDPSFNVESVISKILSIALRLEIPVGEFILEATKRDLPEVDGLLLLLKSNITDEASHLKGVKFLIDQYPISSEDQSEADLITSRWLELPCHPIQAAFVIEAGVLLPCLGLLRIAGGKSICHAATEIGKDESRHYRTNWECLHLLGIERMPSFYGLVKDTLDFIFRDLIIPKTIFGIKLDLNFFIKASEDLINKGKANTLDSLCNFSPQIAPFEVPNSTLYSRVLEDMV
jgi:hypothetical protein